MFDKTRLKEILEDYKRDFAPKTWEDEKYKWVAVKTFQDNWDIDAPDFAEMLERALSKTDNLLTSRNNFPAGMITEFAQAYPDDVRAMFCNLFDENTEITSRIADFKQKSTILLKNYFNKESHKQHYQNDNAISIYLWLRYPDKYYIYKFGVICDVVSELKSEYVFRQGQSNENFTNCISFYNEIREFLSTDTELIDCVKSQFTEDCYSDPNLITLTIDIGYYISTHYRDKEKISDEELSETLDSRKITIQPVRIWKISQSHQFFSPEQNLILEQKKIVSMHKDTRAMGSSSVPQGKSFIDEVHSGDYFYLCYSNSIQLFGRFFKDEATPIDIEGWDGWYGREYEIIEKSKDYSPYKKTQYWWSPNFNSTFISVPEKDYEEFEKLILKPYFGLSLSDLNIPSNDGGVEPNGNDTPNNQGCQYWWLNANPKVWSFSGLEIGKEVFYTLYNESGHKRRIFQNFVNAKVGDIIIGYESNPTKKIVAICKVSAAQDGEKIYFEKLETLPSPIDYATLKDCPELQNMEYFVNPNGSFFKLTTEEYDFIMDVIREENPKQSPARDFEKYDKADFLNEVYITESEYDKLVNVLKDKKNIILQGAPGVGKTFAAKRLAYSVMGMKDDDRIEFVQFHQNYSYEDFVMGYKPADEGFKLKNGVFYNFCVKASNLPDKDFFFIIDEINRGNLSKIFGELLMLIENTHRGDRTSMTYSDEKFSVPDNLYIIGMMNTADRSLAMIDYALRRRFGFFEMKPAFDSTGFKKYQDGLNDDTFNKLIDSVKRLNDEIEKDDSLGRGFCIGHSYFCNWKECTVEKMLAVVDYEIIPMLEEYWFDESGKVDNWRNTLQNIFK